MEIQLPSLKGKELFKYLVENKKSIISTKKAGIKYADTVFNAPMVHTKTSSSKALQMVKEVEDDGELLVTVVANTSFWCDSQDDVLTDTCWDKSVSEKGTSIPHIADHCHKSTSHVGDVKSIYSKKVSLKDLGLNQNGSGTCLIFETLIKEDYNEDVYKFYKNGKINQHSIGLQYVTIGLCINDKSHVAEFDLWNKYYSKVINKEKVDECGYFWIVPEIKLLENSCVLFGSNELTPTLDVSIESEPVVATLSQSVDVKQIINNYKFKFN